LLAAFDRAQPGAIFLDSLCNSAGLRVPEWPLLIEGLTRRAESVVHLIIDNTCTSTLFQPLALLTPGSTVRPLVFESLTKYAQFGLDRAAAGVIVALDDDAVSLDMLREHLGTNVSDHCAGIIPEPNRAALVRRLRRIERNALLLARHIAGVCAQTPGPVTGACYPGLETHPCHSHAAAIGFGGGILALEIEPAWDRVAFQGRLVRALIAEARRRRAPLVAGASFGLNVTRVYRTGSSALASFVRISAGTEDRLALEDLKEVFGTVIRSLNREAAAPSPSLARLHQHGAMLAASGEA
jgi:cystathionine beta-lyase/cystathionine gamma-synthase